MEYQVVLVFCRPAVHIFVFDIKITLYFHDFELPGLHGLSRVSAHVYLR